MKHPSLRNLMPLLVAAVVVFSAFFLAAGQPSSQTSQYNLIQPFFVDAAHATPDNAAIDTIVSEAGISAYFQSTTPVTISSVRGVFETIELETNDYILGSVAIANYPEDHAPHVYVHIDGWFLTYYLNTDPVAKTIDWNAYTASGDTVISTKLENVLAIVAGSAGVGIPSITHYDFRYPNATTMMLIAERYQGGGNNYFTVNIPASFGVAERSWSLHAGGPHAGSIKLNGTQLYYGLGYHGIISAAQMPPATTHTIQINDRTSIVGGLALVYTE